ncbi:phosphate ABC transporter substrate-binding protein PstS [Agromyces sp. ISL-38]|uniref:phosphate ABC transporter substrate-binding protein PstS n=1 Tax=Agromyces sp. ISL-38 TaxID=2819107 RepID=UPI001BEBEF54|nr:phosphate ABC transporter substrate-binding protein PstS [Agromyces sp. ISL-38]MBT2498171.1 phosphate ABC transporter substrate-binding protein PstS [Agromyces sp. ISL-38]MBT2518679.1 phosphate ABC transporter substrate-binding protein PstS [Streptomyces sp. ISL-90]
MNLKRFGVPAVIAVTAAIALSSCAANEGGAAPEESASSLSGNLVGAGSSAQDAAQQAWIAGFQTANPDVTIDYDPSGSGAGRETFLEGASDFAGSDRAFNDEEVAGGGFAKCAADSSIVELPLYISPIAVIFNLEGVDTLNLDAATIAGIFAGKITTWNDPAIAALNDGVELPDQAITPVHRSDDSGTTENFTEYLGAAAPDVWTYEADGVWPFEGGEAAQGTSGVVDAVTNGTGTVGYADASRAGDLGTVAVQVGDEFVPYSPEAASAIVDASPFVEGRSEGDLAIEIDRTSEEAGVYPIVLVSYLIACQQYEDPANVELVKAYLGYIASEDGQSVAAESAGSAPISESLRDKVVAAIDSIK